MALHMKRAVFLSFDLGVKGDYEGLYRWLDSLGAKECGDSLAFLFFEAKSDLPAEIKASLKKAIEVDSRTRIYAIFMDDKRMKGRFLFGQRKAPPWTGFAPRGAGEIDEDVA
jgi:hypothetical protein